MKNCRLCQQEFDPDMELTDPAQLAGQHLAREDYGDEGELCPDCLSSRGRLAMMYRTDCFD